MDSLNKYGLVEAIKEYTESNRPFMGICLGMQMLFEESDEFGKTKGLSLIPGKVVKLPIKDCQNEKLPHVSWNELNSKDIPWSGTVLEGVKEASDMYFTHSFVAKSDNRYVLSTTEYSGYNFCSSVKLGNTYGCQFHPEKSGKIGLKIIKNFIRMCENE